MMFAFDSSLYSSLQSVTTSFHLIVDRIVRAGWLHRYYIARDSSTEPPIHTRRDLSIVLSPRCRDSLDRMIPALWNPHSIPRLDDTFQHPISQLLPLFPFTLFSRESRLVLAKRIPEDDEIEQLLCFSRHHFFALEIPHGRIRVPSGLLREFDESFSDSGRRHSNDLPRRELYKQITVRVAMERSIGRRRSQPERVAVDVALSCVLDDRRGWERRREESGRGVLGEVERWDLVLCFRRICPWCRIGGGGGGSGDGRKGEIEDAKKGGQGYGKLAEFARLTIHDLQFDDGILRKRGRLLLRHSSLGAGFEECFIHQYSPGRILSEPFLDRGKLDEMTLGEETRKFGVEIRRAEIDEQVLFELVRETRERPYPSPVATYDRRGALARDSR